MAAISVLDYALDSNTTCNGVMLGWGGAGEGVLRGKARGVYEGEGSVGVPVAGRGPCGRGFQSFFLLESTGNEEMGALSRK